VRHLFPDIKPNQTWKINRGDIHTLYVEESGNSQGIPVIFLHGGPGTGCSPVHRRFFDPEIYRIILFDQRGCGHSTPHCCLQENTTWHLVDDIEAIRNQLNIDKFVLFGGSWGSTLALAYAQTYPGAVSALILRGIFLCRQHEIEWFYQSGTSRLYPDYWEDFIAPVAEQERGDLVAAYHRLLTSDNELTRMAAARAWVQWETRCAELTHHDRSYSKDKHNPAALAMACIENHYFVNDAFLTPNQLLENMPLLDGIPGIIVHGRYDTICPLENAWQLHHAWPDSELDIIPASGHSAFEPGNIDALVKATDKIPTLLGKAT
jgi:proline iminopeptidase